MIHIYKSAFAEETVRPTTEGDERPPAHVHVNRHRLEPSHIRKMSGENQHLLLFMYTVNASKTVGCSKYLVTNNTNQPSLQ